MTFKTVEGVLHPDGTLAMPRDELPDHPVRVMVTLLEGSDDAALTEVGDYHERLADYEKHQARGDIRWQ